MLPHELDETLEGMTEAYHLLAGASRRFEELFQGMPMACFCYDTDGRVIEWNRACEAVFRRSTTDALQKYVWELVGRPEDREIIQALVSSVIAGLTYENWEWEAYGFGGTVRTFLGNTFPLRGPDGEICGGISANMEITERRTAEKALWTSEERWQLAVRGSSAGIWDWDIRTKKAFFSQRWKEMLGCEPHEVENDRQEWETRLHPDDAPGVLAAFADHLDRKSEFYTAEYRLRCKDGSYLWVLDRGQALWLRDGGLIRVAGSIIDITDRKKAEEALREANLKLAALATTDGLTGLTNHRAFQERLEAEFRQAAPGTLSVILLDVDNFKTFNDAYGHPMGDVVLKRVAALLRDRVRAEDLAARYGGEEFVIIVPGADQATALAVAERCRAAIEAAEWPCRAVTASFGVATLTAEMPDRSHLIADSDRALYASKKAGRNRVTHSVAMTGFESASRGQSPSD